jgi:hypothetical protein
MLHENITLRESGVPTDTDDLEIWEYHLKL